ncbi:alpha/beta hydrolase [Microcella sp.]|uniref:alpha/beta hydrolase n=1 Tax=Microcella sp. TaxID=1913979 RepID=UPI00391D0EAD
MVVDAAAVVVASLTVLAAAGPSVVLEHPRSELYIGVVQATEPSALGPLGSLPESASATSFGTSSAAATTPAIAAVPDLSRLTSTRGTQLLRGLGALPAAETARALAANPQLVERTLARPPAPRQVDRWWSSLDSATQLSLVSAAPRLVGNLDGVPYAMRDMANRSHLKSVVNALELTDPMSLGASERLRQREQLQMLYSVLDALGPATANPPRHLISLDVDGQGKAAIVVGDLATADYVSYLVPGMFISVQQSMPEWVDTAARLHDEQVSWLTLLDSSGRGDGSPAATPTVATVAWIGYQTPHLLNVGSLDLAYEGRDAIASAVLGLQTLRGDNAPYVSLLAHSYGSTAAMLALTETSATVDALAMIGSPGAPGASVATLNVRGDVFVGEAAWDPIPNSSFFGLDPGSSDFGARAMNVAGGIDVITNRVLEGSTGHNAYFSPGTESMRNLALIAIDRGELVTDGTSTDALRTLDYALTY